MCTLTDTSEHAPLIEKRSEDSVAFRLHHSNTNKYRVGFEASENALVWQVYNVESSKADAATLDASHRSIDVLLIFTGLFCTVLTTFIVQAYQFLVQDPTSYLSPTAPMTAVNMTHIVIGTLLHHSNALPFRTTPSLKQLQWVNALWFVSLALSLCNAVFCMLGKQWLQPGRNALGSSARSRARERQRKYMLIKAWHILIIIDALPLLLHISLLLFFAGLVILVWASNHAIAVITCIVLMFVYVSYFGSMFLSFAYPDCPYRHPLSDKLRDWKTRGYNYFFNAFPCTQSPPDIELPSFDIQDSWVGDGTENVLTPISNLEDHVDAHALVWLFENCPNDTITSITLQAIGGLSRNFSAFHILRQAGAISAVLRGFRACFRKDLTLDSQWLVIQPQDAGRYCRAWLRLTYGTSVKWPDDYLSLLEVLRKTENMDDVAAIAACTRAVAFLDVRDGRLMITSYLARYVKRHIQFSQEIQFWLLETFLQCSLVSPNRLRSNNHIAKTTVPILLKLLHDHISSDTTAANVRSVISLCLSYMTGATTDPILFHDEIRRQEEFYNLLIPSLTEVIKDPAKYGADEDHLNQLATDYMQVVTRMSKNDSKDWHSLRPTVQVGLSKLYIQGQISNTTWTETFSDVLQMLSPLDNILPEDRPLLLTSLIRTISLPMQSPLLLHSALSLLKPLLVHDQTAVLDAFMESDGCKVLLDVSQVGEAGSRILQLLCISCVCLFIQSAANSLGVIPSEPTLSFYDSETVKGARLEYILQSQFLHTVTDVLAESAFWSPQISTVWVKALLKLCQYGPSDPSWKGVENALNKFARRHEGKEGHEHLKWGLRSIKALINNK
ncbi:hypothetical protein BDN70DRAFT_925186 [Pholiota conissans]|uniref:DUF6535 domain-containing protein n=1 Tax=Pholiota conissans TaxID=109636 RepID=A0A9P5YQ71_9AGAR|nr:hypothetical protein BDN70DRAFT_925186 [Pholiota conissans]